MGLLPLRAGWALGCLYLAAYGTWGWFFRRTVDPWVQRVLGGRLGVHVRWVRATTFPFQVWVWGLEGPGAGGGDRLLDSRITLGSVAICLAGAFMPTGALCLVLRWSPALANDVGPALYLATPVLILSFVTSHLGWRDAEPASLHGHGAEMGPSGDLRPPSKAPASLDTRSES